LKNAKFDLFGSENASWQIWLRIKTELGQSYGLRHAFSGNSKQLQRHDSVHLSSVYINYSFSSSIAW